MSINSNYNPDDWVSGDIITASRMNTLQNQVKSITDEIVDAHTYGNSSPGSLGARIDSINTEFEDLKDSIANEFDPNTPYVIGDYVWHNDTLHQFTANHNGSWSDNDVIDVVLADDVKNLDNKYIKYNAAQSLTEAQKLQARSTIDTAAKGAIASEYANQAYAIGDYVMHDTKLYKCKVTIASGESWNSAHWDEAKVVDEFAEKDTSIIELKSAFDLYKSGKDTLDESDFIRGTLEAGSINTTVQYRITTKQRITADKKYDLTIADGFRINVYLYSGDDYTSSGWTTGTYTINSGAVYMMTISRVTEDHSEVANIYEFLAAVTYPSDNEKRLSAVEDQADATAENLNDFESKLYNSIYRINDLFDSKNYTEIGFIRPNGTTSDSSSYRHTDYIPIKGAKTLIVTGKFGSSVSPAVFYKADKSYISGYEATGGTSANVTYQIPVPDNTVYVVSSCALTYVSGVKIDCIFGSPVKQSDVCYISPTGDDLNDGLTASHPVKTAQRASQVLSSFGMLIMMSGDYDWKTLNINFDNIRNVLGVDHPRIICYAQKITSGTLVSGYTKVYSTEKTYNGTYTTSACLWQHDIPDSNTVIPENEAHPLNRNRTHRLPSTRLQYASSIADIESASDPKWFVDGNTIYFSKVTDSDLSENPIIVPTILNDDRYRASSSKNTDLSIKNIAILYNGFDADGACGILDNVEAGMCRGEAVISADYCESLLLRNCNFYAVSSSSGGDAVNVHNENDTIAHRSMVTLENCWLHDCSDDGESCHANSNTIHIGCLVEYNGTGITPAGGGTECNNVISRHNEAHSWVVDTAICAGFSCQGNGSTLICIGCVSDDNARGYSCTASNTGSQNCMTLINSTARNNNNFEVYVSRGTVITDNIKVSNTDANKHFTAANDGTITHKSIDMGTDSNGVYMQTNTNKTYIAQ